MQRVVSALRKPTSSGRRLPLRDSSGRAIKRLDLDAAFFWLIVVFLLTVLAIFSFRGKHIELNQQQLAEYERRTQFLSNSTVYIVELGRPENLLSKLPPADWTRLSSNIDFVAFVYDDLPLFLTEDWVSRAETALVEVGGARAAAGIGIALFPCGCVLPNAYFRLAKPRLGGLECLLLPGWILSHKDVHFLDLPEIPAERCRRRSAVLAAQVAKAHSVALKEIRKGIEDAERTLAGGNSTNYLPKPDVLPQPQKEPAVAPVNGASVLNTAGQGQQGFDPSPRKLSGKVS